MMSTSRRDDERAQHIQRIVDAAPPLTDERRAELRRLLAQSFPEVSNVHANNALPRLGGKVASDPNLDEGALRAGLGLLPGDVREDRYGVDPSSPARDRGMDLSA